MEKTRLLYIAAVLLLLLSARAGAQSTIQGTVRDSVTHEVLVGANVYLPGTALGGVTDREGRFQIARVPVGTHAVRASYIGYRTRDMRINVTSMDTSIVFLLFPDVLEGKEVVVTGQRRGQVAAINQQITSNTIVNVISEEKIKELPDANAAEAIGRLPGVSILRSGGEANKVILRGMSDRFTSFTLDGIRIPATDADSRGVDLSMFSQGTLAGVEVFKALTSDKDADAIAGSINMVTRKAPSTRTLRIDAKNAYSRLTKDFGQYDFNGRYGERFFEDMLGVQVTANVEQRDRSNESYNLDIENQEVVFAKGFKYDDLTLNFTDETRHRAGAGLLLDLDTPDGGSIKLNSFFNRTERDYTNFTRDYPVGADVVYTIRDREQVIKSFNSSVRGENSIFTLTLNWGLSFAESNTDNPYDYRMFFKEPSSTTPGNLSGMNGDVALVPHIRPEEFASYAYNNFRAAYIDTANFDSEKNLEKEKTAFLDVATKYALGDRVAGEVKLGGKYRYRNRFKESGEMFSPYYLNYYRDYTRNADGTITAKNFAGTRFANLQLTDRLVLLTNFLDATPEERNLFDKFRLYPLINRDAIREWYELNKNGVTASGSLSEYYSNPEVAADYYDIIERISAGYLMNTLHIGTSGTLIAGIRVENETNDYMAKYVKSPPSGFPPTGSLYDTTAGFTQTTWLPNLQLVIRPAEYMTVRLAAYRAIARPDFSARLAKNVARVTNPRNPLVIGNPGLKNARAWNFELNTSFFGNDLGLVSVSGFYREIKDMFHVVSNVWGFYDPADPTSIMEVLGITYRPPFGAGSPIALTFPYNSPQLTKVWGLEFEHQASLGFLPGLLSNIVLSYNFSLVRSETFVLTSRTDTTWYTPPGFPFPVPVYHFTLGQTRQKLEGQPEFFGNVALGYDIGGFSGRLSVFFQGEYYSSYSPRRTSDPVVKKFSRWDLTLRQRVTNYLSVFFNLNNFTGVEEENYTLNQPDAWEALRSSQRYGLTGDLGVRFEF
jgi:TonB-dependent receptor